MTLFPPNIFSVCYLFWEVLRLGIEMYVCFLVNHIGILTWLRYSLCRPLCGCCRSLMDFSSLVLKISECSALLHRDLKIMRKSLWRGVDR